MHLYIQYIYYRDGNRQICIARCKLPNANDIWGNCESLWPTDSLNFLIVANNFWLFAKHFSNGFVKRPFLVLTPSLDKFYI